MASIGPQLPPHLAKRKRTPDEDEPAPDSPQSKVQRLANEDEIALDSDASDDDNDFGPSAAPASRPKASSIGPSKSAAASIGSAAPPARIEKISAPEQILQPQPQRAPTPPAATAVSASTASIGPSLPPKRVLGPAPPPADLSERPPVSPNFNSDSDSDDDYGPALPSASSRSNASHGPALPSAAAAQAAPAAPQRDAWMLAPPTERGYRVADPTQLKARKFTSGPRAGAGSSASSGGAGGSSVWFETPEEKAKRLADAVLGRAADPTVYSAPAGPPNPSSTTSGSGNSREQDDRIRAFTEQTRGKSLYEEHQATKAAGQDGKQLEEEDDPSKRAFDREKDMALGGKITHSQRREMLNRAADFGGRFQKGKYL